MMIRDAVDLLEFYQKNGQVSDSEASNIMATLIELENYPQNFIIPGGNDFVLIYKQYGHDVVRNIFEFIGECLVGIAHPTNFSMDNRFPMVVQQSREIATIVLNLYFKIWCELRIYGFTVFPYQLTTITAQGGFYERLPREKLLAAAGM